MRRPIMLALVSATAVTLSLLMVVTPSQPPSNAAAALTSASLKPTTTPSTSTSSAAATASSTSGAGSANQPASTDAGASSGTSTDASDPSPSSAPSAFSTDPLTNGSDAQASTSPLPSPTADSLLDVLPEPGQICGNNQTCLPDGSAPSTSSTSEPTNGPPITGRGTKASASADAVPTTASLAPSSSPSGQGEAAFEHPGILETLPQLDFVAAQIAAHAEPWASAFKKMAASSYGSLDYTPHPVADVSCGAYNSDDHGCNAEDADARAAYTQALLWVLAKDPAHAQKTIEILNAWSDTLQSHGGSNAPLVSAWTAAMFTRAAELLRYTGSGWSASDIGAFITMLNNVFLPGYSTPFALRAYASSAGNWELAMAEAKIDIGVFTNNHQAFDAGVAVWRDRVPAYIFQTTDGSLPLTTVGSPYGNDPSQLLCYWLNRNPFSASVCPAAISTILYDGQTQETCRDFVHFGLGMASIINAAETGRIQGIDLYGEQENRIVSALEFNTGILDTVTSSGGYPSNFCDNSTALKAPYTEPTFEIGYNEYANRLGVSMPNTLKTVDRLRAVGGSATDHVMAWETLTSGDVGRYGF